MPSCSCAPRSTDCGHWPADGRDRAFARHLAYGVLRWLSALEWLAGQLLRRPLKRRDRDVQRLILLGLFQGGNGVGLVSQMGQGNGQIPIGRTPI